MEMFNSITACSKFCKYLASEDEKKAILKASDSIDEFSDDQESDDDKYAVPAQWWHKW